MKRRTFLIPIAGVVVAVALVIWFPRGSEDGKVVLLSATPHGQQPLSAAGPGQGTWKALWTTNGRPAASFTGGIDANDFGHAISNGDLLLGAPAGVKVLDARTGAVRWYTKGSAFSGLSAFALSGPAVVVKTHTGEWIALDKATGRVLWRRAKAGSMLTETFQGPSTDRVIPAIDPSGDLVGLDARSGRVRWKLTRASLGGCEPDSDSIPNGLGGAQQGNGVSRDLLVFLAHCGDTEKLLGFALSTGRVAWQLPMPNPTDSPEAPVFLAGVSPEGYSILGEETSVVAVDGHGRQVATLADAIPATARTSLPPVLESGDHLLIPVLLARAKLHVALQVLDIRSGRFSGVPAPGFDDSTPLFTFDGSRIYVAQPDGTVAIAEAGTPNATTGRIQQDLLTSVVPMPSTADWMAAADGSLYVAGPEPVVSGPVVARVGNLPA